MSNSSPSFAKRLSQLLRAPFRSNAPSENKSNDNSNEKHERRGHADPIHLRNSIIKDLMSQSKRIPADLHLMMQLIDMKSAGGYEDDSKYVLEHLIQLVASLPTDDTQKSLTSSFISTLWDNLCHPPLTYLGDETNYRTANGSNNNILYPNVGKAGTPYAKSVVPTHPKLAAPPDPGTLFDALLVRKAYKPHPSKFASMFFHLATLVIHDIFYTNPMDHKINLTSSYLDLSTLYGFNEDDQKKMRTYSDGLLKPDCFFDARLLGFPPAVSGLMIGLNRFHNSVARDLASINEAGRFSMPSLEAISAMIPFLQPGLTAEQTAVVAKEKFDAAVAKRDNDLFQTARLVTCGLYINIILGDYLRTIVAMNRTNDAWVLDPRAQGPDVYSHQGAPSGVGNHVSCEFNLIYRWHATLSQVDEKWVNDFFMKVFPGQDMGKITVDDFKIGMYKWVKTIDPDPFKRSIGGLQRGPDGKFDDATLVEILTASTEDCAGIILYNIADVAAFDSGVPIALRAVTMLGVEQSRTWNTASLNEFRHFFGLVEHKTFQHVNSKVEMQEKMRQLYEHPDNIELYPGILIENTKEQMTPGAGLCPNQTIGKAILSDAVALVRGDRFFTIDYSPAGLTQFGYNAVASDLNIAQGGVLYRVLMRAFPGWYEYNSVYALFPLTIPSENKVILKDLNKLHLYSFKRPSPPAQPVVLSTPQSARKILEHPLAFHLAWDKAISDLTGESLSANQRVKDANNDTLFRQVFFKDVTNGLSEIRNFYIDRTPKLVRKGSCSIGEYSQVDIIRDVIKPVHIQFVAALFGIPLKDGEDDRAEKELYDRLILLFGYIFLTRDEVDGFAQRGDVIDAYKSLSKELKSHLGKTNGGDMLKSYGSNLIRRLLKEGKSVDQVATNIVLPAAAAMAASHIQQSVQMIDVYLSEEYSQHWSQIVRLAQVEDEHSTSKLQTYALEGIRLSKKGFGPVRCGVAEDVTLKEGKTTLNIESGNEVFTAANLNCGPFRDPLTTSDKAADVQYGWGLDSVGMEISIVANTAILRSLARLPNLRRAPGPQGEVKCIVQNGNTRYLSSDWGNYSYLPACMKVRYD